MAKYGEGDARWIVEERPDGANVHNWHWAERDCLEYSRTLLSSLLSNLTILENFNGISVKTLSLEKVEGEAYVNIRKGKIIPGYELSISLKFVGEVEAEEKKVNGSVEIPYVADENADEDPEIRVLIKDDDGPLGKRVKDAMLVKGKHVILEKVKLYVQAMAKGGPCKDELEVKKPGSKEKILSAPVAPPTKVETKQAEKKEKKKDKDGFKSISVTEKFSCRAKDLYEILMDENRWKGFTQSNARISKEVNGEFSVFDGSVMGVNEELKEGKLILQKWRFGSWPDNIYSTVKISFDEPEPGVTVVNLTQTNIPVEDRYGNSTVVENTERGWRDLIFQRIRAVFGFGI